MILPAFGVPGPMEMGVILLIVMMLFGVGKLPQVFETFGSAVKKFRDAQREDPIDVSPPEKIAQGLGVAEAQEVKERTHAE